MMPGMGGFAAGADTEEMQRQLKRKEAIVLSMTHRERRNPKILNGSRRSRIAGGAGLTVSEVNKFLKEFCGYGEDDEEAHGRRDGPESP